MRQILIDAMELKKSLPKFILEEAEAYIDETEEIEAIPYEFIKEQIAKTSDINDEDELDFFYAGHLGYLLKIWEEENEKDI